MNRREKFLADALCEFKSEGEDCEMCSPCRAIPVGQKVYWIADGGMSPDGDYICENCANRLADTP